MFRSFRIGRVLGFPIDINFSFLLLLLFVGLWAGGIASVFAIIVAFGSVLLHELGHAVVARHLGVRVAGIELYFFGGAAKMLDQPKSAGDEVAIAAAGPAVSFVLAGLGSLLAVATGAGFFALFAWINLIIGAFNLIPALPMDGGRILRALLSMKVGFRRATEVAIVIARGFSIVLGLVGLVTMSLQLLIVAGVVWFLGTAELRNAQLSGHGYRPRATASPFAVPFGPYRGVAPDDPDVMPPGFRIGGFAHFHRPRRVGGFVVRQRGRHFVIEPL